MTDTPESCQAQGVSLDPSRPIITRLRVTLVPATRLVLTGYGGQALHGLCLRLLARYSPKLAQRVHSEEDTRPFSISPLDGCLHQSGYSIAEGGAPISFEVGLLGSDMVVAMVSAFFNAKENTMALALGKTRVRVTEVESVLSGPPWRYCEELIEEAAEERQIGLEFLSPTAFRVRSTNYLFPQSNLVFSSLLQHWEPFSGLTLSSCLEGCLDSIVLSRYQLQTELVSLSRFKWIGFKGYAVYTLPHELSPSQVKALNCLSDFAFYSGVGAKTTMGMGQTRRIESSFDL